MSPHLQKHDYCFCDIDGSIFFYKYFPRDGGHWTEHADFFCRNVSSPIPTNLELASVVPQLRSQSRLSRINISFLVLTRLFNVRYVETKYGLNISASTVTNINRAIAHGAEKGLFSLPKGDRNFGRCHLIPCVLFLR